MIKPEDVTIIIPHLGETKEQEYSLGQCLLSLQETVSSSMKKIVAVNGAKCKYPPEWPFDVWLRQQGQCKAVNAAAATVNTEWLFISNDDMVYAPGWWENFVGSFVGNEMCISPNLVEPRLGAPPFLVHNCGGAGGDFDKEKWIRFATKYMKENVRYIPLEGFNLPFLIKKELWDLIGGYDINYDPWGSNGDSDLQAKIYLAGAKTVRNKNCIVYHFSQTSGTFHPDNREYWQRNWNYFIKKWGFPRQSDDHKVWYSKDLIDYDKLKYHPWWEGFYA